MIGAYNPAIRVAVQHISGLDKAGKAVKWAVVSDEQVFFEDASVQVIAKMKVSSVKDARVEAIQTGGLIKRSVPGLIVDYITKAGEEKTLVFRISEGSDVSARGFCGTIQRIKEEADLIREEYPVRGVSFREDAFLEIAEENDDWRISKKQAIADDMEGVEIWRFDFYPGKATLEPEDDNAADPNAVAVYAGGEHIGYIPRASAQHVREVLKHGKDLNVAVDMGGGPFKMLEEDEDGKPDWYEGNKAFWAAVYLSYRMPEDKSL
ncbi:MAG: HIRAN domain-containing protein [Clostridia bacterium]|nr:HIRAN domain-containing protein [Clostridia bacterium]